VPYVLPFAVFMAFLAAAKYLEFLGAWESVLRVGVLTAVLVIFSRQVIDLRIRQVIATLGLGAAVFVLWIAPDLLIPGYRNHPLFQNSITGHITMSIPESLLAQPLVLVLRIVRAVILVPIIEELFWRGWLMRWLVSPKFESLPLGATTPFAMIVTAVLFASEHGPYWDVGLVTGFLYNWWMVRTRSLGDCILAHAVTNGCLSAYVVIAGKWEYWM
jgi:CAAX prenyl protease-like protein